MSYGRAEIWTAGLSNPARAGDDLGAKDQPPILTVLPPKVGSVTSTKAPPAWLNLEKPSGDLWGPAPAPPPAWQPQQAAPAAVETPEKEDSQWEPAWAAKRTTPGAPTRARSLYDYSARDVWYADNVAVPEKNSGVVITREFPTHPSQDRRVQHHFDEAIRSVVWNRVGQHMPSVHEAQAMPSPQRAFTVDGHEEARDLKGLRRLDLENQPHYQRDRHLLHNYTAMIHQRKLSGWLSVTEKVKHSVEREIMTASEMDEFFENEEAVMYERVDYWNLL